MAAADEPRGAGVVDPVPTDDNGGGISWSKSEVSNNNFLGEEVSLMAKLCPPLFALSLLLLSNHAGYAQQSDTDQVKAAIDALNAALSSLDMTKMDAL